MTELSCEKVLMAIMAHGDGESAELSTEQIQAHLSACQNCHEEVARTKQLNEILRQVMRAEDSVDLWPAVSRRLGRPAPRMGLKPYAFVAVLLFAYKLFEMLPEEEPGWAIKLVPLIIFGALLVFVRENPFRINSELVMEK